MWCWVALLDAVFEGATNTVCSCDIKGVTSGEPSFEWLKNIATCCYSMHYTSGTDLLHMHSIDDWCCLTCRGPLSRVLSLAAIPLLEMAATLKMRC